MTVRRFLLLVTALTAFGAALLLHESWLPGLATWLDVGETPRKCQYVCVLGGNSEIRPFVAAELIRLGFAEQALIPGQKPSPEVIDGIVPATEEIEAAVFRYRGISNDQIGVLEGEHHSTFDEARSLKVKLENQPSASAIVITNAYHSRRARWVFRTVFGNDADRLCFVSAPNPTFRDVTWWRTPDGTKCVVTEYLKLFVYWLRYGRGLWAVLALSLGLGWMQWRAVSRRRRGVIAQPANVEQAA